MKWFKLSLLLAMTLLVGSVFADAVMASAPGTGALDFVNSLGYMDVVKMLLAGGAGWLLKSANQNIIEHAIDPFLPIWVKPFKSFIPSIIGIIAGKIAMASGLDAHSTYAGVIALVGGTHAYNGTAAAAVNAGAPTDTDGQKAAKAMTGVALLLALMFCGSLKASDVLATTPVLSMPGTAVAGWLGGPSTTLSSGNMIMQADGSLLPSPATLAGVQYGIYRGNFTQSTNGSVNFDPSFYIASGIAFSGGIGDTRPCATASIGYTNFGLAFGWPLGLGAVKPYVGIQATMTGLDFAKVLDWDISHTVRDKFPSASW